MICHIYHGKDNGLIVRIECICFMSGFCYLVLAKNNKILAALLGVAIGFISFVISYFVIYSTNLKDFFTIYYLYWL